MSSGTAKRRKIGGGESKLSSSLVQLGSCHSAVVTPETSVSQATSENLASDFRGSSQSSHHVQVSCCSSNALRDFEKETFGIVDLEVFQKSQNSSRLTILSPMNFNSFLSLLNEFSV